MPTENHEWKWDCPHAWLTEAVTGWDIHELRQRLLALAYILDHDTIQSAFEHLMSADGYFDPLPVKVIGPVNEKYMGLPQWEVEYPSGKREYMVADEIADLNGEGPEEED